MRRCEDEDAGKYPNPRLLSPYESDGAATLLSIQHSPYEKGGCLVGKKLETIERITDRIAVTLSKRLDKPHDARRRVNLTLSMQGTDDEVTHWEVINVRKLPFWITLPEDTRIIPKEKYDGIHVVVDLNAQGLAEKAEAYAATLEIRVASSPQLMKSTIVDVPVKLFLESRTAQIVWGAVAADAVGKSQGYEPPSLVEGIALPVKFTSCDHEGLPVAHALPNDPRSDPRQFEATGGGLDVDPPKYVGLGIYEVTVTAIAHGNTILHVVLNTSEPQSLLPILQLQLLLPSSCPTLGRSTPLDNGKCGCLAGQFENKAGECVPCNPGYSQPSPGQDQCIPCDPGSYQPSAGQAQCIPCPSGTRQPVEGKASCELCPARQSSSPGSTECDVCDMGYYRNTADTIADRRNCKDCPGGARKRVGGVR